MYKEKLHPVIQDASIVNFHLLEACNMRCGFCFATFRDTPRGHGLKREESLQLVYLLCQAGFRKINFAGGEPTLRPWLPELIRLAKSHRLTTSIVTNGSQITPAWLDSLDGSLDIIALSIDSVDPETQRRIGRVEKGQSPISAQRYLELGREIKGRDIRLKVNTVVSAANHTEDFRAFVLAMLPERWKIFQVLAVSGQNDSHIDDFVITEDEFRQYVELNTSVAAEGIRVVLETNTLMTSSYVMIDPSGRFFDNSTGRYSYSKPILEVGVSAALEEVHVDAARFEQRGGNY